MKNQVFYFTLFILLLTNNHCYSQLNSDQKASYAMGIQFSDYVRQYFPTTMHENIDYNEFEKGLIDFFKSNQNKKSYIFALQLALQIETSINQNQLEQLDKEYITKGLMDALLGKDLLIPSESVTIFLDLYIKNHTDYIKLENARISDELIKIKEESNNVKMTTSGLLYENIKPGTGAKPYKNSIVKIKYTGRLLSDNKIFDSTKNKHNENTTEFSLNNIIPGLSEGIQLMTKGSITKFYIPYQLAYGEHGSPVSLIGPNQALEFEVELVDFRKFDKSFNSSNLNKEQIKELQKQFEINQADQQKN